MKNHELLDLIGEAGEDYVLAAGSNVIKPRFRWKTWAAVAACAALVVGGLACQKQHTFHDLIGEVVTPLHAYTIVEGGALTTEGDLKASAGEEIGIPGQGAPVPEPAQPPRGDGPSDIHGGAYFDDAPAQEAAQAQYLGLLQGLGGQEGYEPETYPDWFAGAWIDWETLHVAIVDGLHTPELEAEITGWCGDGVVFQSAKYSHNFLDGLMDPVARALDGTGLSCGIGVDVTDNCLGVDLYSDGAAIPDSVLAELAKLDPAGDAIRVRLFTGSLSLNDGAAVKGPAPVPGGVTEPVFDGARVEPGIEADPTPTPAEGSEQAMSAAVKELPEAKYDALKEADAQSRAKYDIIEGE